MLSFSIDPDLLPGGELVNGNPDDGTLLIFESTITLLTHDGLALYLVFLS